MPSPAKDIVSLRLCHCRAERTAQQGQYHLATLHYLGCLEMAERREDCKAVRFFALRLAECYSNMGLSAKAQSFRELADYAALCPEQHEYSSNSYPYQSAEPQLHDLRPSDEDGELGGLVMPLV